MTEQYKETYEPNFPVSELSDDLVRLQSRFGYKSASLIKLAKDIEANTQLQPIVVSKDSSGLYEIIDGYRRTKAIKEILKRPTIKAIIREGLTHEQALKQAIAANQYREAYTPNEVAVAVYKAGKKGVTDKELAKLFNETQVEVSDSKIKGEKTLWNRQFNPHKGEPFKKKDKPLPSTHRLSIQTKAILVFMYNHSERHKEYLNRNHTNYPNYKGVNMRIIYTQLCDCGDVSQANDPRYSYSFNRTLRSLTLQGLIDRSGDIEEWDGSEGRNVKFHYLLTEQGEKTVKENLETWNKLLLSSKGQLEMTTKGERKYCYSFCRAIWSPEEKKYYHWDYEYKKAIASEALIGIPYPHFSAPKTKDH